MAPESPIPWVAPRLDDGARILFQSGGGRLTLEEPLGASKTGPVIEQNLSNWCLLDWTGSVTSGAKRPSGAIAQALAVARKILTRGRRPVLSPYLEQEIVTDSGLPYLVGGTTEEGAEIYTDLLQRQHRRTVREELGLALLPPLPRVNQMRSWTLDSAEEEEFLSGTFPAVLGPEALAYLHPQVLITNLLGSKAEGLVNARVDFLFSPPGASPLVIEIDDQQHHETKMADEERDRVLQAGGYRGVRLSTGEAAAGDGPGWDQIRRLWEQRAQRVRPAAEWAIRLLWAPAIATRVQLAVLHAVEQGVLSPSADRWEIQIVERDVSCGQAALQDLHQLLTRLGSMYGCDLVPSVVRVLCLSSDGLSRAVLGEDVDEALGCTDHLDLDVSVFCSYVLEAAPVVSDLFPGWGSGNLLEIRAANIPRPVAPPACAAPPATLLDPGRDSLTYFLQYIFRKRFFRDGQVEAIARTLAGLDSIVLLPTGAGKSIIYQLSGLLLPGVTIVVDPIISLIEDQLYNLRRYGIDRAIGISSQIEDPQDRAQALHAFGRGDFFYCFLAPERLQTPQFRQQCRALVTFTAFNLWAIDEAHCVSEWGHDFRTAYLNLGRVARDLGRSGEFVPPILALTGTASRAVLRDVQRELQITDVEAVITPKTFDRPELRFDIVKAPTLQKAAALSGALQRLMTTWSVDPAAFFSPNGRTTLGGLVFCPHVNGEHGVVQVAEKLRAAYHTEVNIYSGSAPKGQDRRKWNREKSANALRFKENEYALLVCTKAFGMGIDKPNIRYTVHYGIPGSLESFYQEAGRAGRDRQQAFNLVIFSNDQPDKARRILDPDLSLDQVRSMRETGRTLEDDVGRMLFFHLNSFAGVGEELSATLGVLTRFGVIGDRMVQKLSYTNDDERSMVEKAIHRLHLMGIVEDYTLDFSGRQFEVTVLPPSRTRITEALVRYVQGYSLDRTRWIQQTLARGPSGEAEFIPFAAEVLIRFIYDVIEKARRTALREVWVLAAECRTDEEIRRRLLEYLQGKYAQAVDEMVAAGALDLDALGAVLKRIEVASELVTQAIRFLRRDHQVIEPRVLWKTGGFGGRQGRIPEQHRLQEGRALCMWGDAGWGSLVHDGKYECDCFSNQLVEAVAEMIQEHWGPEQRPSWVTAVPSLRHPDLVPDFARRLAARLGLQFLPVLRKVRNTPPQKHMQNSAQQARNALEAFSVTSPCPSGPVLLVDDIVDSRWTLTVCGVLLREAGSGPVFPVGLATAAGGGDTE